MAAEGRRGPRPSLVLALGLAAIALIAYLEWPSASPSSTASNPAVQAAQTRAATDSASLDVRLGTLKEPPPAPDTMERNPFRFQPKPPPPAPAAPSSPGTSAGGRRGAGPGPTVPQGPPPIPLKFIGRLESASTGVVAIFSDGRGLRARGREGDTILGQYRVVRIGVESVVLEYLDGTGRQTIPLTGQGMS